MSLPNRLAGAAALISATLALAACGGGDSGAAAAASGPVPPLRDDQRVSITWETYNLASEGPHADTVRDLVARFERANPNIDVTAQAPSGQDFTASVQRAVVAGKAPDVAQLGLGTDLDFVANTLRVTPLDDLVGIDAVREQLGGKYPYHPRAATLTDFEGKTYGIPYVFSTPIIYVNQKLAKKAGVRPDDPLGTWDEVAAAAGKIASETDAGGIALACLDPVVNRDWCLQGIIRSAGGEVISDDRRSLPWTDAGTVQALTELQSIVKAGAAPNIGFDDAVEAFSSGRMGMLLTTSAVQGSLLKAAKGNFAMTATGLPSFGDRPSVPTNSGSGLYILAKDLAKARAAWELTKFLTGPEAETEITRNIGYLPLRTDLLDEPQYLLRWGRAQGQLIEPNVAQLDRLEGVKPFPGRSYNQIRQALTDATQEIVYGGAAAKPTLAEAIRQAEPLMPGA